MALPFKSKVSKGIWLVDYYRELIIRLRMLGDEPEFLELAPEDYHAIIDAMLSLPPSHPCSLSGVLGPNILGVPIVPEPYKVIGTPISAAHADELLYYIETVDKNYFALEVDVSQSDIADFGVVGTLIKRVRTHLGHDGFVISSYTEGYCNPETNIRKYHVMGSASSLEYPLVLPSFQSVPNG